MSDCVCCMSLHTHLNDRGVLQAPHIRLATYKVNVTADSASVTLSNDGHGDALFRFCPRTASDAPTDAAAASNQPTAAPAAGTPPWLCISPIRGVVPAGGSVQIQVRHRIPQLLVQACVRAQ